LAATTMWRIGSTRMQVQTLRRVVRAATYAKVTSGS
jgi:hypothetical protein